MDYEGLVGKKIKIVSMDDPYADRYIGQRRRSEKCLRRPLGRRQARLRLGRSRYLPESRQIRSLRLKKEKAVYKTVFLFYNYSARRN